MRIRKAHGARWTVWARRLRVAGDAVLARLLRTLSPPEAFLAPATKLVVRRAPA